MGEIPGAEDVDPLPFSPLGKVWKIHVAARGPREARMDVKVSDQLHNGNSIIPNGMRAPVLHASLSGNMRKLAQKEGYLPPESS